MVNEEKRKDWGHELDGLEYNLEGARLKFGNTFVDPHDPRIRRPHSRVIPDRGIGAKGVAAAGDDNAGGLLQTGDHRPASNVGALKGLEHHKEANEKDQSGKEQRQ